MESIFLLFISSSLHLSCFDFDKFCDISVSLCHSQFAPTRSVRVWFLDFCSYKHFKIHMERGRVLPSSTATLFLMLIIWMFGSGELFYFYLVNKPTHSPSEFCARAARFWIHDFLHALLLYNWLILASNFPHKIEPSIVLKWSEKEEFLCVFLFTPLRLHFLQQFFKFFVNATVIHSECHCLYYYRRF